MSRVFHIISHTVGKAGHQRGPDVQRVKELLALNGYPTTKNDHWDASAERGLLDFRRRLFGETPFAMIEDADPNEPNRASITPNDMVLFELAYRAKVLIRLCPTMHGEEAIKSVHDWLAERDTEFSFARVVWGLAGMRQWAIVTTMLYGKKLSEQYYGFQRDTHPVLSLNCTLYANLMMSVWLNGGVHDAPFAAGISESGEGQHLAVTRYKYKLLGEYDGWDSVQELTKGHPNRLFCLDVGDDGHHIALLLNGMVLECNAGYEAKACHRIPGRDFFSKKGHEKGTICGPAPR
jgi:hypothetical protein